MKLEANYRSIRRTQRQFRAGKLYLLTWVTHIDSPYTQRSRLPSTRTSTTRATRQALHPAQWSPLRAVPPLCSALRALPSALSLTRSLRLTRRTTGGTSLRPGGCPLTVSQGVSTSNPSVPHRGQNRLWNLSEKWFPSLKSAPPTGWWSSRTLPASSFSTSPFSWFES